jgi:uncharacterized protein (TIGR02300 family)
LPKPELGTKRTCLACGARFYDFGKTADLACPACGAVFDLELLARARRPRTVTRAAPAAAAVEEEVDEAETDDTEDDVEEVEDDVDDTDEEEADEPEVVETEDDEEEDALIEDASELGDDDALGDVIDKDADGEEERR